MSTIDAFIATNRFGLGPCPGDLADYATDPRGRLLADLAGPSMTADASLPTTKQAATEAGAMAIRDTAIRKQRIAEGSAPKDSQPGKGIDMSMGGPKRSGTIRGMFAREIGVRYRRAVSTQAPFRERLIHFWSNHFTVSVIAPVVVPLAGPFEREAIAPHITGRFADMLKAATLHPAMMTYLDQVRSVGPRSVVGQKNRSGLNENLGREILELHTLGVGGGYTQADVIALAKILSGWGYVGPKEGGNYGLVPNRHEPGDKVLLGKQFVEAGPDEAIAALDFLAAHPATARFLATKLVRHFVADEPPSAAVDRIAATYMETTGDLGAVSRALVGLDEAWQTSMPKIKTPWEYAVAVGRAVGGLGAEGSDQNILRSLRSMGQQPFGAPSPAGWPDTGGNWLGPDALLRRIDFARAVAARSSRKTSVEDTMAGTIAPVAPQQVLDIIRRAGDKTDALAMIFLSPQFQRR